MQLFYQGGWFELVVFLGTDPGRLDLPGAIEDDNLEDELVLAFADAVRDEQEYLAQSEDWEEDW